MAYVRSSFAVLPLGSGRLVLGAPLRAGGPLAGVTVAPTGPRGVGGSNLWRFRLRDRRPHVLFINGAPRFSTPRG